MQLEIITLLGTILSTSPPAHCPGHESPGIESSKEQIRLCHRTLVLSTLNWLPLEVVEGNRRGEVLKPLAHLLVLLGVGRVLPHSVDFPCAPQSSYLAREEQTLGTIREETRF